MGQSGTADYAHDDTDQLTDADYNFQSDEDYDYDDNGNRTNNGYTVGTNNRLTADGTYTYLYDAEGNRTARFIDADTSDDLTTGDTDITEYTWDHRNRLTAVTHYADYTAYQSASPDQIVEYAYDFGNRWVRKVLDSNGDGTAEGSTVFVSDGNRIALQFDKTGTGDAAAGDLSHRYLWGPAVDQILADEQVDSLGTPGDVLWPLTDHLGSVRDLASYDAPTDTTTIANHRTFDAFGNVTSETAPAVDHLFAFTGRALDEDTALQNNLNRWYDAGVGRWLSEDPIGFGGDDPSLARYVQNDPTYFVDPPGLDIRSAEYGGAAYYHVYTEGGWFSAPRYLGTIVYDPNGSAQHKSAARAMAVQMDSSGTKFGRIILPPGAKPTDIGNELKLLRIRRWLVEHPQAQFGRPWEEPSVQSEDLDNPREVILERINVSRPWSVLAWDTLAASVTGVGTAPSEGPALEAESPGEGAVFVPNRDRDWYLQNQQRDQAAYLPRYENNLASGRAKLAGGAAAIQGGARALEEAILGVKRVQFAAFCQRGADGKNRFYFTFRNPDAAGRMMYNGKLTHDGRIIVGARSILRDWIGYNGKHRVVHGWEGYTEE